MLTIFNARKQKQGYLDDSDYTDLCIESKLLMDDKILSFTTSVAKINDLNIAIEGYVLCYDSIDMTLFVIKEINMDSSGKASVVALKDLADIERYVIKRFYRKDETINEMLSFITADDVGWTINPYDDPTVKSIDIKYVNGYDILKEIGALFHVNFKIDNAHETITIVNSLGADHGVYLSNELNLKNLSAQYTSYDLFTRLIAYDKNGQTFSDVNDGKAYITNFKYIPSVKGKVKTYIWEASDYEDHQLMLEDAKAKLEEMAKPNITYSIDAIDIAKINPAYYYNEIQLGDVVTIIDSNTGIFDKQIAIESKIYPHEPQRSSYVFANRVLTFEELIGKNTVSRKINNSGSYSGNTNINTSLFSSSGD